jgi:hypothetical protein
MRKIQQLFLGLRLVSKIFEENIQTKLEQHFGGFFVANKSATARRKKGF